MSVNISLGASTASAATSYTSPASSTSSIQGNTPPSLPTPSTAGSTPRVGEPGFKNPHDKKGRSTSCLLCQKRKQKCDHRLPSCTTCIKAGVKCVQPAKYAVKAPDKDEYTIMLEKKVKFLEKILDSNNIAIDQHGNPNVKKNFKYKKLTPFIPDEQQQQQQQQQQPVQRNVSASPNITHNNFHHFLQTSQPVSIASVRKLPMIQPQDDFKKPYLTVEAIDYSKSILAKYNLKEFLSYDPVFEVDEKISREFLDIHFTRLHFKYPLLDEEEIFEFHNAYVTNNNLTTYMSDIDYFHYCCSRMWMIYAISSSLHMTTGKYTGPPPERYFSTAIRHITKCQKISPLQNCEILALTVLYLIRTDRDSVLLYEIIKDALEFSVSLGLNRSQTYWTLLPKDRMKKMRIWWCVYLLERMICIAVGKPHSLCEKLVDPDLPLFEYEPSKGVKHPNNVNFINQSIKLRRIESRFVEELNIIAENSTKDQDLLTKVDKFFQELNIWRGNCEIFSNGIENETLRLYYYRSVRLLIQPFLELMDPQDRLFRECQASAGHICQLFKVFHERTVFGHSTTAIHTVFSAGVTLIYCLWLARNKDDEKRKKLGDDSKHTRPQVSASLFNGLNDLRACSVCLYVMAERSKFALVFRDTFDQLMSATIANLVERCGPDSSEIIYGNEPGMPPAIVRKTEYRFPGSYETKRTAEDRLEQAERKRKKGQLQKNVVPKSLSHLLLDGAEEEEQMIKIPKSETLIQHGEVNLASFQYPSSSYSSQLAVSTPGQSHQQQSQSQQPHEITLFNGRTNRMINNISVWTGEAGGAPITTSLFDHSANAKKQGDNLLWNVPVEDLWTTNEDYGFLGN